MMRREARHPALHISRKRTLESPGSIRFSICRLPTLQSRRCLISRILPFWNRKQTGSACEVFVNRSAPNHHLTIEVREKRNDQPDEILMRHYGPLAFRDTNSIEGLLIARNPVGNVSMYTGRWTKHGDALTAAIDLRSEEFHASNELRIDLNATRPSIMIQDGIFHTAAKTSDKLKMKLTRGKEQRDMPSFATLIGANIYLEQGAAACCRRGSLARCL